MTLPSTGSLSMSQVNSEIGYASTHTTDLNDANVRVIASRSSGTVKFSDLRGQSFRSLSPSGSYGDDQIGANAVVTLYANPNAVWTWSKIGGGAIATNYTVSVSSGGTASSITFTLKFPTTAGRYREALFNVSATNGPLTGTYSLDLIAESSSGGGGGPIS